MAERQYRTLTKRTVDRLSVNGKDAIFWDRDLPGFGVRVIATIARRLDSLGAITRGQRDSQTAMGGDATLFRESDNLESLYAKAALRQFYGSLWLGRIPGWSVDRFEKATGLKLAHEGSLKEELPPMPRFLNRLLALPIDEQNELFAQLEERIAANIEQAVEAGSFEVGVETVRADSLSIAGRETIYEHPGTGAATELAEILRRDRLVPTTAEAALGLGERDPGPDGKPVLMVNARSKRAAAALPAPSRMFDDGGVQERVRLVRPAMRESMARAELDASNWRRADESTWRTLWEAEIASLPTHRDSRFWLAAGLLLPIWDRLPAENMRVRRLTTDAGEALIGRVLDAKQVRAVRTSFGLDGGFAMTGSEVFEAVMGRGTALALANGWRLARRRIMGADRVEIEGPADGDTDALKRMGCTVEIVSWRARAFAPGAQVLERNHLTSGGRVANLSVATDESYLNKQSGERVDKTEWHRIVTFQDGLISMFEKHAKKGRLVYIDGKLQTRRWTKPGEDGDRFSTEILLVPGGRVQFLDVRHEAA